jgi:hypothetical protein
MLSRRPSKMSTPDPTAEQQLEAVWTELVALKGVQIGGLMREALEAKFTGADLLKEATALLRATGAPIPSPKMPPGYNPRLGGDWSDQQEWKQTNESTKTTADSGVKTAQKTKRDRSRHRPGPVNAKSSEPYLTNGGYYRMPNEFAETLLAVMPGPVLKAYVYAHRLAEIDGTFYISAGKMAKKIGATSTRHGERVLARLEQAGLLREIERGGVKARRANTYQLVPLSQLDIDLVAKTLKQPLAPHARKDQGEPSIPGPECR